MKILNDDFCASIQNYLIHIEPPVNHMNENVKRIRHVMRESRQRQAT